MLGLSFILKLFPPCLLLNINRKMQKLIDTLRASEGISKVSVPFVTPHRLFILRKSKKGERLPCLIYYLLRQ